MDYYDRVQEAVDAVRSHLRHSPPAIAIVLGSGLGHFAGTLLDPVSIVYERLPHWPRSDVEGHEGRLVIGTVNGQRVAALAGRSHVYEGHDVGTVTFAVRVLACLGVKILILTNAAGGINTRLAQGGLMVIDDHLNLTGLNPLVGPNENRFGPRFPDMTEVYSSRLRSLAAEAAAALGVHVTHGVYAAVTGPGYETPAEIRYLRTIGADAVGMSTVLEAMVARHMGVEVLGISCIGNMAAGVLPGSLSHEEVLTAGSHVRSRFMALLEGIIGRL